MNKEDAQKVLEIVQQLVACHDEPLCPAVDLGRECIAIMQAEVADHARREQARYTPADLRKLAADKGPFATDNMRQALHWVANVLIAADGAVQSELRRAEAAEAQLKKLKEPLK